MNGVTSGALCPMSLAMSLEKLKSKKKADNC